MEQKHFKVPDEDLGKVQGGVMEVLLVSLHCNACSHEEFMPKRTMTQCPNCKSADIYYQDRVSVEG